MNEIQFLIYSMPDGDGKVQVVIKDETIWCTQKAMAHLFGVGVPAISKHLSHIFEEGELEKDVVVSKMEIPTQHGAIEGKTQLSETAFYSLDAIIAVGYRVNSLKATRFRQWATKVLHEYIQKGFVMDDERLKQAKTAFGKDYFRELLERVRSIRASERRKMVQNRFHYAITGKTAPEIIYTSADHTKEHMGLETWKNAPDGRILLSDTKVAKNYLPEKEIRQLERAVTGYFDYIEDLIERENAFTMEQFAASVNEFLTFRRYALLPDKGTISRAEADRKAEEEYKLFNPGQQIDSDFDKHLRGLLD